MLEAQTRQMELKTKNCADQSKLPVLHQDQMMLNIHKSFKYVLASKLKSFFDAVLMVF